MRPGRAGGDLDHLRGALGEHLLAEIRTLTSAEDAVLEPAALARLLRAAGLAGD